MGGLIPCLLAWKILGGGIQELLINAFSLFEEQMLHCREDLKGCAVPVAYLVCCLA